MGKVPCEWKRVVEWGVRWASKIERKGKKNERVKKKKRLKGRVRVQC